MAFVLAVLITSILLMNAYTVPDAYGQGLGKKETEPKNVGDRIASLKIEIAPELIEFGEVKDILLTMELVDAQTEENIPGTAYQITIEKFADNMLS